jgi:acyl carrier protein
MDDATLRTTLIGLLQRVAPEVEAGTLDERTPLREQVDLDSMDWLNFLIAVHERFKIEIPEADYERLRTLADLVAYVGARLGAH